MANVLLAAGLGAVQAWISLTSGLAPLVAANAAAGVTKLGGFEVGKFTGGSITSSLEMAGSEVTLFLTNSYCGPVTIDYATTKNNLIPSQPDGSSTIPSERSTGRYPLIRYRIADNRQAFNQHTTIQMQFGQPVTSPTPYVYALPFAAGDRHRVTQGFNGTFTHTGPDRYAVDFPMPEGTVIVAARNGTVLASNDQATTGGIGPQFLALEQVNWVLIRHDDGTIGSYFHLRPGGVSVRPGQTVRRGQPIGRSGFTGYATEPHLHFHVMAPLNGHAHRSFPFVFKTSPVDEKGHPPEQGVAYTAFEAAPD